MANASALKITGKMWGHLPSTESFGEGDECLWRQRHVGGRDVAGWASTILLVLALENCPMEMRTSHLKMCAGDVPYISIIVIYAGG